MYEIDHDDNVGIVDGVPYNKGSMTVDPADWKNDLITLRHIANYTQPIINKAGWEQFTRPGGDFSSITEVKEYLQENFFKAPGAAGGISPLYIHNQNTAMQMGTAWVQYLAGGTVYTNALSGNYQQLLIRAAKTLDAAVLILQDEKWENGNVVAFKNAHTPNMLSVLGSFGYSGLGGANSNYFSPDFSIQGYALGANMSANGSYGIRRDVGEVPGIVLFHTDDGDKRLSFCGKSTATGATTHMYDVNATTALQIDDNDRVFCKGTANEAEEIGDYLLGINDSDGKVIKTRSLAREGTPTGSADASGQTGQIVYDSNFIYVKTGAGWKRSALAAF